MMEERERVADVIEHASHIEEQIREGEVKAARALSAPEHHPDFDGLHCIEEDCGTEIHPDRLAMHRIRCVDCQARKEARGKQFRGGL